MWLNSTLSFFRKLRRAGTLKKRFFTESDVETWKNYVKEHQFNWVNVGGTNVNIDYQEAYNVHGAPTMIILNWRRDIIMNKVLPAKNLMTFLDEYEKKQQQN